MIGTDYNMLIFVPKNCAPSRQPRTSHQVSAWGFSPVLLKNVLTLEYLSHANDKTTCQPEEVGQVHRPGHLPVFFSVSSTMGNPSGAWCTQHHATVQPWHGPPVLATGGQNPPPEWDFPPSTFIQKPALQCNISHASSRKLIFCKYVSSWQGSVSTILKWFAKSTRA